jgi:hypothetical protein
MNYKNPIEVTRVLHSFEKRLRKAISEGNIMEAREILKDEELVGRRFLYNIY